MSTPLAFPANNVAGNFIVVAARARFANQTFTVSDTRSNVYRRALTVNNGTDDTLAIFYAENIAAGANTVTVAVSTGPASIRLAILEYAGIAQANALDGTATAAGSSTAPTSGSATTTTAGDLVLGVFSTQSGRTFTAGSGSTIREAVSAAPSTNLMVQDRIQATAGAITATATLNTLDVWGAATRRVQEGGERRASDPHQRDRHQPGPGGVDGEPATWGRRAPTTTTTATAKRT